jgi:hypothetical protein
VTNVGNVTNGASAQAIPDPFYVASDIKSKRFRRTKAAVADITVSVYDGRTCLGFVLNRGKLGFEALHPDQHSLGVFPTQREAVAAFSEIGDGR